MSRTRHAVLAALQVTTLASAGSCAHYGTVGDPPRFAFCAVLAVYGLVWCERLLPTVLKGVSGRGRTPALVGSKTGTGPIKKGRKAGG